MKHLFTLLTTATILLNYAVAQNVGQVAPDFTLKTLDNADYKLSANQGKVILVFMVGYNCPLCKASSPVIKSELIDVFGSNLKFDFLIIDTWDGSTSEVNDFKTSTGLSATYLQKGGSVAKSWLTTYDRLLVIDSEGKIVFKGTRAAGSDVILAKNAVQDALKNLSTLSFDLKEGEPVSLGQNYPNPANDKTTIEFSVASSAEVSLKILDITGKVVTIPVHEILQAGKHTIEFETDELPDGIYFYKLNTGNFSSTKKMIINR